MKRSLTLIPFVLFVLATVPVSAGIIPTGFVLLEDDDFDLSIANLSTETGATDTQLDVGDVLVAMYTIQAFKDGQSLALLSSISNTTKGITGVVVLEVVAYKTSTAAGIGEFATYSFKPYSSTWASLSATFVSEETNAVVTRNLGLANPQSAFSIVQMYEDPASDPANHIDANKHTAGGEQDFAASFDTATEGLLLYEFGIKSAIDGTTKLPTDVNEIWTARTQADIGLNPRDILQISSLSFEGALSQTYINAAAAYPTLGITRYLNDFYTPALVSGSSLGHLVTNQLIVDGTNDPQQTPPTVDVIFPLGTDGNFTLRTVPEPASVLVWAALATIGGVGAMRRRRV